MDEETKKMIRDFDREVFEDVEKERAKWESKKPPEQEKSATKNVTVNHETTKNLTVNKL